MSRLPEIANPQRPAYPSDLSDAEWGGDLKERMHEVPCQRRIRRLLAVWKDKVSGKGRSYNADYCVNVLAALP